MDLSLNPTEVQGENESCIDTLIKTDKKVLPHAGATPDFGVKITPHLLAIKKTPQSICLKG